MTVNFVRAVYRKPLHAVLLTLVGSCSLTVTFGAEEPDALALAKQELAEANRILASEGITDAFGHVSVRSPLDPGRYIMSDSRSPSMVRTADLLEFELSGEPVDADEGRALHSERPIHGAIYEARPDIRAVLHAHTHSVLPFTVSDRAFRPVVHNAAMLGPQVPVWDMRRNFGDTNLLVREMEQGRDLAACLGERGKACLMRGHGLVIAGRSVKEVVWMAIAMDLNARVLGTALRIGEVTYLSAGEVDLFAGSEIGNSRGISKMWRYWLSRADVDGI